MSEEGAANSALTQARDIIFTIPQGINYSPSEAQQMGEIHDFRGKGSFRPTFRVPHSDKG